MKIKYILVILFVLLLAVSFAASIDVKDFGAKGDGITDDTNAFQLALNAAEKGKFDTVVASSGNYLFKGHLVVPSGVALKGSWVSVPSSAGIRDIGLHKPTEGGTTFLVTENPNNEKGDPFILLNENSTLMGVVIFYPNQVTNDVPIPYPWAVAMRGNNPAVLDCELLNPYNGIDASKNQRSLVRNISGQPLRRGIFADQIYDISRFENIHFNPWFSMSEKLWDWQLKNGEAFIFGKSDWHYVTNTFCYGYNIGYRFIDNGHGPTNAQLLGIGADGCNKSIVIDSASPIGLLITNGEFVAMFKDSPVMVDIKKTNYGNIMFQNCSFWGPCDKNVNMENGNLTLQNCNFFEWDRNKKGSPSIDITGGSVIINSCRFNQDKLPLSIKDRAKSVIFTGNMLIGKRKIYNTSKTKFEEASNIFEYSK